MMPIKNIAVLGGGAGGFAAAVDLTQRGFSVNLFELPQFQESIREVMEKGKIEVKGPALKEGFVTINRITTDIREALRNVDMVIVSVPGYGVEAFAEHAAPHLQEGQMVVVTMAATLGALRFYLKVKETSEGKRIRVAETSSLPYGSRRLGSNAVNVLLKVQNLFFAAFPSRDTAEMMNAFRELYASLVTATNVMETTLNNGNAITHPAGSLLNVGQTEFSKGEFYLYPQGISPGVARVIEAVDRERLAICRTLGFKEVPTIERLVKYGYSKPAATLYEEYHNSPVFSVAKGPVDIHDRYITEDIPYGLVLWSTVAKNLGIRTPLMDAFIEIGSALCGRDFRKEGLTAERLGLGGMDASRLNHYLMTGSK